MAALDLQSKPHQLSAVDDDPAEPSTVVVPQSPQFEIPGQLWMLMCIAGALMLVSTVALFVFGQGSIGL